jgi:hypothetical protein
MPETRVLDWILSDSDEGPSSGKEECAGEGAAKWARGLPHICEHKCLSTTKRCGGSGEDGVEVNTANQRGGGSEWEPIKNLLEGDGDSNKTNTASNTSL